MVNMVKYNFFITLCRVCHHVCIFFFFGETVEEMWWCQKDRLRECILKSNCWSLHHATKHTQGFCLFVCFHVYSIFIDMNVWTTWFFSKCKMAKTKGNLMVSPVSDFYLKSAYVNIHDVHKVRLSRYLSFIWRTQELKIRLFYLWCFGFTWSQLTLEPSLKKSFSQCVP